MSVAQRYGQAKDLEFLNMFAHPNVSSLDPLSIAKAQNKNTIRVDIDLEPRRGIVAPANQLYTVAYLAGGTSMGIAETFGVGMAMPTFISRELLHYRDSPLPAI
jgi:hypothetical protein